jgi:hypothetical protein
MRILKRLLGQVKALFVDPTPGFIAAYGACADQVSAGTGINRWALLVQWAVETATGAVVIGYNLGNIRCSSTTFCRYTSLDAFAHDAITTWHNGYYQGVLATAGQMMRNHLIAIGQSPWDAGHYNSGGGPGSSLISCWQSQFHGVGDSNYIRSAVTLMSSTSINLFLRGSNNALFTNRYDYTNWSGWRSLGGSLGSANIVPIRFGSRIDVFLNGSDMTVFQITSLDDGLTWGPFITTSGGGDGLTVIGSAPVQIPGPQGLQGPIGLTGPQGVQGLQGVSGPPGINGNEGPIGPIGPQGSTGLTGATGPTGPAGTLPPHDHSYSGVTGTGVDV